MAAALINRQQNFGKYTPARKPRKRKHTNTNKKKLIAEREAKRRENKIEKIKIQWLCSSFLCCAHFHDTHSSAAALPMKSECIERVETVPLSPGKETRTAVPQSRHQDGRLVGTVLNVSADVVQLRGGVASAVVVLQRQLKNLHQGPVEGEWGKEEQPGQHWVQSVVQGEDGHGRFFLHYVQLIAHRACDACMRIAVHEAGRASSYTPGRKERAGTERSNLRTLAGRCTYLRRRRPR